MSADAINRARPGDLVTVDHVTGGYPLRDGLQPGDVVRLLKFDHGWWDVRRESDGLETKLNMMGIDRIVEPDASLRCELCGVQKFTHTNFVRGVATRICEDPDCKAQADG